MASSSAKVFGQKLPPFTVRGILLAVLILWIVFLADWLVPFLDFHKHGIYPRTLVGLWGIATAPVVHANFVHLLANSIALIGLLVFVGWEARARAWLVIADLWILSGLGTWLIGRGGAGHVGASGVIYGLITYLVAAGLWAGHWRSFLIGLLVLFFYGSALWGVLPPETDTYISWEAHLSGAISGVLVAWLTYDKRK